MILSKLLLQKRYHQNTVSKTHPQKIHFQNFSLKKCILKITPSEKSLFKNYSLQKYIFKITPSKKFFSYTAPSKIRFSTLLSQIIHFQNLSLKKGILENCSFKNTFSNIALSKSTSQYLLLI